MRMLALYVYFSIASNILNSVASISFSNKENLRLQLENVAGVYKKSNNTVVYDLLASQGQLGNKRLRDYLGAFLCKHNYTRILFNPVLLILRNR